MKTREELAVEETIGVDIGGTKIAVARVETGQILEFRRCATPRPATPRAVTEAVLNAIGDWPQRSVSMGVACAGGVADGRVSAITKHVFEDWTEVPLTEILTERSGLPTIVLNDGQAAAWGENRFGGGRNDDSMAFITVSTGVGGGLVHAGKLLYGASGLAGHIGHLTMDPNGPWCTCGRRGCLEQLVSGTAIAAEAEKLLHRPLKTEDVFGLAREGEPWAHGIIRESARFLAAGIANLHMLFDPAIVVLGGGVGLAEGYLELVRHEASRLPLVRHVEIVPAELGVSAGVLGAADLASKL